MIINIGIDKAYNSSCSTNIFFTAGSKSQAIPDVLPATIIESIKAIKIFLRCFLLVKLPQFDSEYFQSNYQNYTEHNSILLSLCLL